MTKKILLVDDHPLFAKSVSHFLMNQCDVLAKWTSESSDTLGFLKNEDFDLVIIDIDMPKVDGFSLLESIRENHKNLPVLIVSMHNELKYILRGTESGASGYVLKSAKPAELIQGVNSILQGKEYFCRSVLITLAGRYKAEKEKISKRQQEILKLTAQEFTIKEIAHQLGISPHTVVTHRKNLMDKLCVRSQVGLAIFAIVNGYG